jgi:hypothetical protein
MGDGSNDQTDARFVEAGQGVPQIHRDALGDAGRDQQDLPLICRARQHPRPQRLDRRHEIHRDQLFTGEHVPRPTHSHVTEVSAPQPLSVTDQQLNSRLQTQQAARPRPQPARKVLETGSKSCGPSARFHTPG